MGSEGRGWEGSGNKGGSGIKRWREGGRREIKGRRERGGKERAAERGGGDTEKRGEDEIQRAEGG